MKKRPKPAPKPTIIYAAYTADRLELPVAQADTADELAAKVGLSPNALKTSLYRGRSGKRNGLIFRKLDIA